MTGENRKNKIKRNSDTSKLLNATGRQTRNIDPKFNENDDRVLKTPISGAATASE